MESHFVVVALGDSLTAGYRSRDPYAIDPRVPYPAQLESMLRATLAKSGNGRLAFVINKGINGDLTEGMLKRIEQDVVSERSDVVVIWGGVNDLGVGRKPESVIGTLLKLYHATRASGAEPVACTLTPMMRTSSAMMELNEQIRIKCTEDKTRLADLFPSFADENGNLLPNYSDDGAHLTVQGYSLVARIVYYAIKPLL